MSVASCYARELYREFIMVSERGKKAAGGSRHSELRAPAVRRIRQGNSGRFVANRERGCPARMTALGAESFPWVASPDAPRSRFAGHSAALHPDTAGMHRAKFCNDFYAREATSSRTATPENNKNGSALPYAVAFDRRYIRPIRTRIITMIRMIPSVPPG